MQPADRHPAPWSPDEVASLNGYQASGAGHPFTCGVDTCLYGGPPTPGRPDGRYGRTVLQAGIDGWQCPACGWTQDWAFAFMADGSWRQPGPWPLIVMTGCRPGE